MTLSELARRRAPKPPAGLVIARSVGEGVEVAAAGGLEPDAVVELGSITKVATGLLLADAVVRAEATLDTTLDEAFPGAPPLRFGDLASHTSGLPRMPWAQLRRSGLFSLTDPYAETTVERLVADAAGVRMRRRKLRYSNLGAALLGQAIAARAGTAYEALLTERVLEPLGLAEVWATGAPEVAQPHTRRGRPVPPWTMGAYAPAGCLRGTARGALALATACLDPPPEMADAVALALTPRAGGRTLSAGLGWLRSPAHRGAVMWWHNGGTHGSRSFCALIPETGDAVAAVSNAAKGVEAAAKRAW